MSRSAGRRTIAIVEIACEPGRLVVASDDPDLAARTTSLLAADATLAAAQDLPATPGWYREAALARTEAIRKVHADARLAPFDSHAFWAG